MRVAEYVSLAHLKHRSPHTREVLEELGIYGLHDQALATLSGGELQLVTLARAIAQKPKLILLDEPTSALDLNHQMRTLSLINELKETGIRIISVMHDLSTVGLYCDDLLLINQGRLLIHGKSDEVLHSSLLNEAYENSIDILKLDSGRSIIYGKDYKNK
jgi:iron complex transport system ATP-binding protein